VDRRRLEGVPGRHNLDLVDGLIGGGGERRQDRRRRYRGTPTTAGFFDACR
jgi:hypothetical protein